MRQPTAEDLLEATLRMSRAEIRTFAVLSSSLGVPYRLHYLNLISRKARGCAPEIDSTMPITQSSDGTTKDLGERWGDTAIGGFTNRAASSVDLSISKLLMFARYSAMKGMVPNR